MLVNNAGITRDTLVLRMKVLATYILRMHACCDLQARDRSQARDHYKQEIILRIKALAPAAMAHRALPQHSPLPPAMPPLPRLWPVTAVSLFPASSLGRAAGTAPDGAHLYPGRPAAGGREGGAACEPGERCGGWGSAEPR